MTQTANNYGTVLYELGVAGEVVAETERIFSLTPELSKSLGSPIVSAKEKHKLIDSIFPQEVRNFLKVLCDNGSVGELADIFSSYHTCYDAHNGILRATLSYVTPPTESQLAQMKEHLKKEYGKNEVQIELIEQPDLHDDIKEGDTITVKMNEHVDYNGKTYPIAALPENLMDIIQAGGLVKAMRKRNGLD